MHHHDDFRLILVMLYAALNHMLIKANISEQFGTNKATVTVTLESMDNTRVSYGASVVPKIDTKTVIIRNTITVVQLMIPYNEKYNLSIVASLCGHNTTTVHELIYGKFS